MGNITSTLVQPAGRTLFSFLRRDADATYWNADDEEFQVVDLLAANEAARAPFRVLYDDGAGTYTWSVSASTFIDGSYTYTSQELSGETEYGVLHTQSLTVISGNVSGHLLTADLEQTADKTLFSFIKRNRDGLFYNAETEAFGLLDLVSAPENSRADFRVSFEEDPPGTYTWSIDVSDFENGTYTVSTRELIGALEILAGADYTVGVYNGAVVSGVALGEVALNHNTGSTDALRYVTGGGTAISGAKICVYTQGDLVTPVGITFSNSYGRWESPVLVPVGATYVITFAKPGAYGPDQRTVTV